MTSTITRLSRLFIFTNRCTAVQLCIKNKPITTRKNTYFVLINLLSWNLCINVLNFWLPSCLFYVEIFITVKKIRCINVWDEQLCYLFADTRWPRHQQSVLISARPTHVWACSNTARLRSSPMTRATEQRPAMWRSPTRSDSSETLPRTR